MSGKCRCPTHVRHRYNTHFEVFILHRLKPLTIIILFEVCLGFCMHGHVYVSKYQYVSINAPLYYYAYSSVTPQCFHVLLFSELSSCIYHATPMSLFMLLSCLTDTLYKHILLQIAIPETFLHKPSLLCFIHRDQFFSEFEKENKASYLDFHKLIDTFSFL